MKSLRKKINSIIKRMKHIDSIITAVHKHVFGVIIYSLTEPTTYTMQCSECSFGGTFTEEEKDRLLNESH